MSSFDIFRRLESTDDNQEALRQEVKTYKAAGAIVAGDFVELDASKTGATRALYVKKCTALGSVGNSALVGVALEAAAAADDDIRIVTHGYVTANVIQAGMAAGKLLCGPITVAGRADLALETTHGPLAVALEAATANLAAIWLFPR